MSKKKRAAAGVPHHDRIEARRFASREEVGGVAARQLRELALTKGWDVRPYALRHELEQFLEAVRDQGSRIDLGAGNGIAELWVTVVGTEFRIRIEVCPPASPPPWRGGAGAR